MAVGRSSLSTVGSERSRVPLALVGAQGRTRGAARGPVADLRSAPVLNEPDASGFRDGDPEAVRAVYRSYGGLVYTVAHRVLGDRGLAEEATQQAFVQAWRAAGT